MGEKKIRLSLEKPVSIREKVYAVVREDILNGRFSRGNAWWKHALPKRSASLGPRSGKPFTCWKERAAGVDPPGSDTGSGS